MPTPENGESYAPIFLRFESPDELYWRFLDRWIFAVIAGLEGVSWYFLKKTYKRHCEFNFKGGDLGVTLKKDIKLRVFGHGHDKSWRV